MPDVPGYRMTPAGGPAVRTDIIDVFVFRRSAAPRDHDAIFLQVLRASEPLASTWHPVMGHIEKGETAAACALRELEEEVGLGRADPALLGLWALEQVHPFYIGAIDTIVMSPRFAAEVAGDWEPRLSDEHTATRWITASEISSCFMWPGQIAACREIIEHLLPEGSLSRTALRVPTE
jgi:8-oxo-dGTP pyrophosphatase MutT (NUDIX family)